MVPEGREGTRDTALVTGAAGFMGAHLARSLQENRGLTVVAVDDLSGGFRENIPRGVEFREGSVTDHGFIERLFDEFDFRHVYHLAAYAAEGLSHFIRRFNYTNNVIGSMNLINEAVRHGTDCFVFTSSIAVYGSAQVPMRESIQPRPEDPYGIAKYAVEMDLAAAQELFGLDYVVFRPHNVFGPLQNIGDRYRNVVGIFMNQILSGQPLTIFGDGEQKRAFSYIDDVIPTIAAAPFVSAARNRVFNIGADVPYSVNELAREVCKAMGAESHPKRHLPARNEVLIAYSDHEMIREAFGPQPSTPLDQGLRRMAAWVREVGVRATPRAMDLELTKNLPAVWTE